MAQQVVPLTKCPSNPKEAIDWILRVTGKDGQDTGTNGTAGLAKALHELLTDSCNGFLVSGLNVDADMFRALREWLNGQKETYEDTKKLIARCANELAAFIGFKKNVKNGLIGVGGIAVSNDPLERLRDGMLEFSMGVLEELKRYKEPLALSLNENQVDIVIGELRGALGGGVYKFEEAINKAAELLKSVNLNEISEVWKKLANITTLSNSGCLPTIKSYITVSKWTPVVEKYFAAILGPLKDKISGTAQSEIERLKASLTTLVTKICSNCTTSKPIDLTQQEVKKQIDTLTEKHTGILIKLRNAATTNEIDLSQYRFIVEALVTGTNGFLRQLHRKYVSLYQGSQWPPNSNDPQTCAKIFLACVPFIWSNLSYLCWRCNLNNSEGGIKDLTLGSGDAKDYMFTMGYNNFHQISGQKMGSDVFATAMKGFKDFQVGMQAAESRASERPSKLHGSSRTPTFPEFLHELEKPVTEVSASIGSNVQNNAMSLAHLVAKCYFKGLHLTSSQSKGRPSTIREMLYWLAGLPFAPGYQSLKAHVSGIFRGVLGEPMTADPAELRLPVAISGSTSTGDFFSPTRVTSYLTITACTIPNTLAFLQGRSDASGPLLHSVFSNSMKFKYPTSGAALFSELCDYAYALKSHLSFLHQQCKGKYSEGFGWRHCKYGQPVNKGLSNGDAVPAWICSAYNCTDAVTCHHYDSNVQQNGCSHNTRSSLCGQPTTPSPLQAFLTDTLKGFRLNSSDSISVHLDNHSPGSMCHVKMGFTPTDLINAPLMGYYLYYPLNFLCGNPKTPLPQLCDQLTCLSRRTPRTLGDLFGFYWHLAGQMFNKPEVLTKLGRLKNRFSITDLSSKELMDEIIMCVGQYEVSDTTPSGLSLSLETIANGVPFWQFLFIKDPSECIVGKLYDLSSHCHADDGTGGTLHFCTPSHDTEPGDLRSIYSTVLEDENAPNCLKGNCAGYLRPIMNSYGTAFAPKFAATYLSWIIHLTEDFYQWLEDLRKDFEALGCSQHFSTVQIRYKGGRIMGKVVQIGGSRTVKPKGVANSFTAHSNPSSTAYPFSPS
ncbi:variant erythrocyte surface antigen-1 family protein [Babesia caballi]|uniref:Variant erythrocyte surface antigen-1 family protein n=1 Tax=Babesia caballi TaxID=5871 RepID=A0AAV4LYS6_BABCB|nr:variant erythrocyte surface antigen-1 family protein [Babesia caballi]